MSSQITIDDTSLIAGLDKMLSRIFEGCEDGLADGADLAQDIMEHTDAHGDQSGATRASYRAFVIGGKHTGSAESSSGYSAAVSALSGFTGHSGRAESQDSGVTLTADERGVLLTSYTDYQIHLEQDQAGAKATIGPTLQATTQQMTRMAADGARAKL